MTVNVEGDAQRQFVKKLLPFYKYIHTLLIFKSNRGKYFYLGCTMQFITGQPRQQTYFSTLEDQVGSDNAVRLIDAFIDKLDLQKLGFSKPVHQR